MNSMPVSAKVPPIDDIRLIASGKLDPKRRAEFGQFMTPWSISRFMASLFRKWPQESTALDAGAGVGSLTEALMERFLETAEAGSSLSVTAYEIDPILIQYLRDRLAQMEDFGAAGGRKIETEIVERDFIKEGAFRASFGGARYSHAILNPPYKKIGANSEYRLLLRKEGVETVNLYTAFLGLAVALTREGGEIVAIVPRSFCNGAYFRPFREWLLGQVAIRHIHVFESRKKAFSDDDVLQENIIVRFEKGAAQDAVTISTSHDATFADYIERVVPFNQIVKTDDAEKFIHIPTLELNGNAYLFAHTLNELGLDVATGPVVDFRVRSHWQQWPSADSVPLLYTHHFAKGKFVWPREHKKPNAVALNSETKKWLMPQGWYTITKRFSAKEERRRLVAYVVDPGTLPFDFYGFENHLNVIHAKKQGLNSDLARGVALFLNSTIVDQHFRSFSGHTQVNATDLRSMLFPSRATLIKFGRWAAKRGELSQAEIDEFVDNFHGK
jgi:hypothetical protein